MSRRALLAAGALAALGATSTGALGAPDITFREPAPGALVAPHDRVTVGFSGAVTLAPGSIELTEIGAGAPPPPSGGIAALGTPAPTDSSRKVWYLDLGQPLASGATYRVRVYRVGGAAAIDSSWTFATTQDLAPPRSLTAFTAAPEPGGVALAWSGPVDLDRAGVRVVRQEGDQQVVIGLVPEGVSALTDVTALPGRTYAYSAAAYDRDAVPNLGPAFLAPSLTLPPPPAPEAAPSPPPRPAAAAPPRRAPRLVRPRVGAVLRPAAPVGLRWRASPRASYYNVQLFRAGRKLLSVFPARGAAVLPGRDLRRPGVYRLRIWIGVGSKLRGRYLRTPWIDRTLRVYARST